MRSSAWPKPIFFCRIRILSPKSVLYPVISACISFFSVPRLHSCFDPSRFPASFPICSYPDPAAGPAVLSTMTRSGPSRIHYRHIPSAQDNCSRHRSVPAVHSVPAVLLSLFPVFLPYLVSAQVPAPPSIPSPACSSFISFPVLLSVPAHSSFPSRSGSGPLFGCTRSDPLIRISRPVPLPFPSARQHPPRAVPRQKQPVTSLR